MKINTYIGIILAVFLVFGGISCTKEKSTTNTKSVINVDNSKNYNKIKVKIIAETSHEKGKKSEFTSEASSENGSIKAYEWKLFKKDGAKYAKVPAGGSSLASFSHYFNHIGEYKLVLKVTDNKNEFRSVDLSLNVTQDLDNSANNSHISIKINHDKNNHQVHKLSKFSADVSTGDSANPINALKWSLYYRGADNKVVSVDITTSDSETEFYHKFAKEGEYRVSLKATDSNGEYKTLSDYFNVGENKDNSKGANKITINWTVTPSQYAINATSNFDASASTSTGGAIEKYVWDLYSKNDLVNSMELTSNQIGSYSYRFSQEGEYLLKLKLIDAEGNYKTENIDIVIPPLGENNDPHNKISPRLNLPEAIRVNQEATFTSVGTSATVNPLTYEWKLLKKDANNDFLPVSIGTSNGVNFDHTFTNYDETFRVSLKVSYPDEGIYKTLIKEFVVEDIYPPVITQKSLTGTGCNDGSGVVLQQNCIIELKSDEKIKISDLNKTNIKLVRADSGLVTPIDIYEKTTQGFKVKVSAALAKDANYRLIIKGISDLKGNKTDLALRYSSVDLSSIDAIFYVKSIGGDDTKNGTSWNRAFKSISKGVNAASQNTPKGVVFVAGGDTYVAATGADYVFNLKDGVKVYGGFNPASAGNNSRSQKNKDFAFRDPQIHTTTLSAKKTSGITRAKNIVVANNIASGLIDGFEFIDIKSKVAKNAAIYATNSAFVVNNCTFSKNIYNESDSNGTSSLYVNGKNGSNKFVVSNSRFLNNKAEYIGGALYATDANLEISATKFFGNAAEQGGAIYMTDTQALIKRSSFYDNKAITGTAQGGAILASSRSKLTISDTTFYANIAKVNGSAINSDSADNINIVNATFADNSVQASGTDTGAVKITGTSNSPQIKNSLFWNNGRANDKDISGSNLTIVKTMTKAVANYTGGGIIAPPTSKPIGTWNNTKGYLPLSVNSSAKNIGDNSANSNTIDQLGNKRKVGIIDLGAVEAQ